MTRRYKYPLCLFNLCPSFSIWLGNYSFNQSYLFRVWFHPVSRLLAFPPNHFSVGKESACNAGDPSSIPGWGRSAGEGIGYPLQYSWASLVAQLVKKLSEMWDTWVWSLGWEDPLKKGKATYSSILAWVDCIIHGVTKSWTWLSYLHFHFHSCPGVEDYTARDYIFQPPLLFDVLWLSSVCKRDSWPLKLIMHSTILFPISYKLEQGYF